VLDVATRRYQHVALDGRIAIEKNEDLVIPEDHFVVCTLFRVTVGNEADKARPFARAALVCINIESLVGHRLCIHNPDQAVRISQDLWIRVT
jgi:hypothetical protein